MAALDLPPDYDLCFAGYGTEPPPPNVPTGIPACRVDRRYRRGKSRVV